jgi:hypothetical protein
MKKNSLKLGKVNKNVDNLDKLAPLFLKLLKDKTEKPNLFIVSIDSTNQNSLALYSSISERLKAKFDVIELELSTSDIQLAEFKKNPATISFRCIVIDSGAPESIRDILKETLFQRDLINKNEHPILRLNSYGLFVPSIIRKFKDIATISFAHGGSHFYRYRVALTRLSNVQVKLKNYLEAMLSDCPNHLFQNSPRVSKGCWNFKINPTDDRYHGIVDIARKSAEYKNLKDDHENLEKYFLQNDIESIASEVPVWLEPTDFKNYHDIFKTNECITGHIDLIKVCTEKNIWIWDYKPNAFRDITGSNQVFLYSLMLSSRTGIPLDQFRCGYFDTGNAFYFNPSNVELIPQNFAK